jgi:hypothetical protein
LYGVGDIREGEGSGDGGEYARLEDRSDDADTLVDVLVLDETILLALSGDGGLKL